MNDHSLLFVKISTAAYFDSFGIEYIPQDVLYKVKDKSITHNICRVKFDDTNMCGFYCIAFIKYVAVAKNVSRLYKFLLMTIKRMPS